MEIYITQKYPEASKCQALTGKLYCILSLGYSNKCKQNIATCKVNWPVAHIQPSNGLFIYTTESTSFVRTMFILQY